MLKEVRRVIKDSSIYGLGSLLPKAAGIILTPIYTAYLTRDDYGQMSLALLVSSMVGVVMLLGQNGSLVLYYRGVDEGAEGRRELLFSVFCFVMLFGGVMLALGLALGPAVTPHVTGGKTSFYPYILIAWLIAFAGLAQSLQQAVNRALGQAKLFITIQLATFAINTGLTLYLVVIARRGALGSLMGSLGAVAIMAPVCIALLVRHMRPRFSRAALGRSLRFGVPLVPHYFAGWLLTYADRVLLLRLSSIGQVGLYSLAYNLSMGLNLMCHSINQAWGPIYYDLAETEEGRRTLPRLTTIYASTITGLAIAFTLFGPDLLVVLASRRFHAAAPVVPVVAAGYFFFAMYMVVATPIFHARKTWWVPAISGAAAVLNVGVNLVLIPRYGMMGAATATLIAYLFMALVAHEVADRLQPGIYEGRKLLLLVGVYALALAVTLGFEQLGLTLWLDVLAKLAVLPVLLSLFVLFRIARWSEVSGLLKLRQRRGRRPAEPGADAAQQAREAEVVGHTADDTGMNPDDVRL